MSEPRTEAGRVLVAAFWLHAPSPSLVAHTQARIDWDGRHTHCGIVMSHDTKHGPLTKRSVPCEECWKAREVRDEPTG